MVKIFTLLMLLYPRNYRAEFGEEMRSVFLALMSASSVNTRIAEILGLVRGAGCEHLQQLAERTADLRQTMAPMVTGTLLAFATHALMYWNLVPIRGRSLARILEHLSTHLFVLCVLAGVAAGQQPAKQDPAVLAIAQAVYSANISALREAKSLDDMKKLADNFDSSDWISVDRFGRTVFTRRDIDKEFESMLALPADRRITGLDIIWAERDSNQLIVIGWMMPNEVQRTDSAGEYGRIGATHRIMRGTLFRDMFSNTSNGWRRVKHEKLLPNDLTLAVDDVPRIVPPLDERNRVVTPR